jgi:hypothetical protein
VKPSEQRGGTTPDEAEAQEKGPWAATADERIVPAELGGPDAPRELLGDDPTAWERSSRLDNRLGGTEVGVDRSGGDHAGATTDGGPELPAGVEPDLKDAAAAGLRSDESP